MPNLFKTSIMGYRTLLFSIFISIRQVHFITKLIFNYHRNGKSNSQIYEIVKGSNHFQ